MFKIALDAGHGLHTPGKRCSCVYDKNETREWFLNNRICDKVEEKLKKYSGYLLLRVDDTTGACDVPLDERVRKANDFKADIYLSVHHNAGLKNGKGGGIISIVYSFASARSLECQKIIYDELIAKTGLVGNRTAPMPKQNLYVLRETTMPAVLVECGFMDSASDVPVILSDDFAEKAAEGLVAALVEIGSLEEKRVETFKDIKGHWAEKEINELCEMGVIRGRTEDTFAPDEPVTRAEVAVLIKRAIDFVRGE